MTTPKLICAMAGVAMTGTAKAASVSALTISFEVKFEFLCK